MANNACNDCIHNIQTVLYGEQVESEHNENCLDNDRVKEENLFEYCYNNHTYDEEKLSENPISTILRKRYPSSIMRYCYEECYH